MTINHTCFSVKITHDKAYICLFFPLPTSNFVTFTLQGQKGSFVSLQIFETGKGLIRTLEVILEMHLKHMNGDMFEHLTVYLILYTIHAAPLKQVISAALFSLLIHSIYYDFGWLPNYIFI